MLPAEQGKRAAGQGNSGIGENSFRVQGASEKGYVCDYG